MTTYCRACDHVHPSTRGEEPWRWRCIKVPVSAGFGFVDPDYAPDPPYAKCSAVNTDGECPMFSAIPQPDTEATPKTRQYEHHKRSLEAVRR